MISESNVFALGSGIGSSWGKPSQADILKGKNEEMQEEIGKAKAKMQKEKAAAAKKKADSKDKRFLERSAWIKDNPVDKDETYYPYVEKMIFL